ncbi:uncharacterized protein LOC104674922 isoform X8 [Rhinopithecus roxellana]|uniref:uncharacterized protein LOC104674922 isoform X8 n=1 Tax=Rhinopithecus roxellana TaxID=61622 RepID=UPI0012371630|nr:uncharacterized protein LOC104674922 isoform X8 [Rhinopithecus roxellana]
MEENPGDGGALGHSETALGGAPYWPDRISQPATQPQATRKRPDPDDLASYLSEKVDDVRRESLVLPTPNMQPTGIFPAAGRRAGLLPYSLIPLPELCSHLLRWF